jgi:hypothetical protein
MKARMGIDDKFLTPQGRRTLANGIFVVFLGCVLYSGFAYPLTYGSGLWPFNRDWFMFSSESGYDYILEARAITKDGAEILLDPSQEFRFPIGAASDRFQETPRNWYGMQKLATFLCAHYPIREVTLNEISWQRKPGRRLSPKEVPADKLTTTPWIPHFKCS